MNNLIFRQPREARVIAGSISMLFGTGILFFTMLVALESFTENPVAIIIFMLLSLGMITLGFYFALCRPVVEIDIDKKKIIISKSCLFFRMAREVKLKSVKEIGIKEAYYAGSRTQETGAFYFVEIRGRELLQLPGTRSTDENETIGVARNLAEAVGVAFNPICRKVLTGSYKLK
jgi:hypothetical protein